MQQLASDLWVSDTPLRFLGLEVGARMTVVRLPDGGLWLHSPVRAAPELVREVQALGPVTCLVAPNKLHHLFVGEWQQACQGQGGACKWSYTPATDNCDAYETHVAGGNVGCNTSEYDHPVEPDGEWLLPTGFMSLCYADHGAGNEIFDLSGNAKEWTAARSAGVNPLRGGSMNNVASGSTCTFNFTVANDTFRFQNVGFRCCSDSQP